MFIIGLTGGIGSGKSAVSQLFEDKGIVVADADIAARQVVEPSSPAFAKIAEHFGPAAIADNGSLNRAYLREQIFADTGQKQWLEELLHPLIAAELQRQLNLAAGPYAILASPLLLETTQKDRVNRILVVDCDEQQQIERSCRRDGNSETQIKAIMATQLSRRERLACASDIIDNSGSLEELQAQVDALHSHYCAIAKTHHYD